ncbi:hypothetical protein MMC07_001200 [Pseudocyphellaria aurata]|nr:hypothetical protein [Pseudocyphellaria aurata]
MIERAETLFDDGNDRLVNCLRELGASRDGLYAGMTYDTSFPSTAKAFRSISADLVPKSETMCRTKNQPEIHDGKMHETMVTTIPFWKEYGYENGIVRQGFADDCSIVGLTGLHVHGQSLFGHGGDSFPGNLIGAYLMTNDYGNDYSSAAYFTCSEVEDLFEYIQRISSAKDVELLPHPIEESLEFACQVEHVCRAAGWPTTVIDCGRPIRSHPPFLRSLD